MPNNIEVKAIARNVSILESLSRNMSKTCPKILHQEDVFFNVPHGRLKLRIVSPNKGELIFYARPDITGPKQSTYCMSGTDDPIGLKETLAKALAGC